MMSGFHYDEDRIEDKSTPSDIHRIIANEIGCRLCKAHLGVCCFRAVDYGYGLAFKLDPCMDRAKVYWYRFSAEEIDEHEKNYYAREAAADERGLPVNDPKDQDSA